MAKREQVIEEKTLGLIAQAQAEYEKIVEEIRSYCQKARELRYQADKLRCLHGLFYNLAVQQVQVSKGSKRPRNPLFYEYFNRKKEEGKAPTQALVCVMRWLVNIIYGMMKHKTAFRLPEQTEKQAWSGYNWVLKWSDRQSKGSGA